MKVAEDMISEPEREQLFIRLYMTLTGVSEPAARSVFMYAGCEENIGDEDAAAREGSNPGHTKFEP